MKMNSSLENERNEPIIGGLPQDPRAADLRDRSGDCFLSDLRAIGAAAAACDAYAGCLAFDCMKSLMRGTISDLNRDPLNTP
jgi:hypothetical protein